MSAHRKRTSPTQLSWMIVLVFAVIILSLFFVLSNLGPRSASSADGNSTINAAALAHLEESRSFEEQFDERLIEGVVDRDDMDVLLRAINSQKEYIAALPARDFAAENRLNQLQRRYSEYMGEILSRDAERLEAIARKAENPGDALISLREALSVRERIRDQHGTSSRNDLVYLARLQREVQNREIQPIFDRSVALEEEGDTLAAEGRLEDAVQRFATAARLQEEINRNYPNLRLAQPLRANRLREKEAEVLSGELRRQIQELISEANDLILDNQYQDAVAILSRARDLQRNLNLEYPRSPYASRSQEGRLRVRMQNASAFENYQRLRDLEELLNRSLQEENFQEASLLIGQISDRLSQFEIRYSLSSLPIDELASRVSYLERKQRLLDQIESSIQADLLPIRGEPGVRLLSSEVPQYLYELIMDANPSRNAGMDLPVETVSIEEVEQFLERVGWILARQVRLPTVAEFRKAAEAAVSAETFEILSADSGENQTRPVESLAPDAAGFYHLLGNVSEMARPSEGSDRAVHIGGNLRTIRNQIIELSPIEITPGERNRMVGFRFVVEDESLPLSLPRDPEI